MSASSTHGLSRLRWTAGAMLVLATFASLGSVFWASTREQSLEPIRRAFAARRWGDVETGLVFTGEYIHKIDEILPVKEIFNRLLTEAEQINS